MAVSQAIPLVLFDDPAVGFTELTANLKPGERYQMVFDYAIKELPAVTRVEYLEDMLPNAPLMGSDFDLDSWEWGQGALGACGHFAAVCAYAAIPRALPIALENGIYPTEKNPYGLYFIRIANPDGSNSFKWMAIDSRFSFSSTGKLAFCKQQKPDSPFLPQLLLKSMAVIKGGCWDEITNFRSLKNDFTGWFPNYKLECNNFEDFKTLFEKGCIASFTYQQQYDAAGAKITPAGIVYGHAFALCDYVTAYDEKGYHFIVRVQNPWNSGSEFDSYYHESKPFWTEHPELAHKLAAAKVSGGNYWMGWDELMKVASGKKVTVRVSK